MSLVLKPTIVDSLNCLTINFQDSTGVYSPGNTGGYNAPNIAVADVTRSVLSIILPDGTTLTYDETDGFYPLFPNTNGSLWSVPTTDIGNASDVAISDWITQLTYSIFVSSAETTVTTYVAILCNATCCVNRLLAKVDFTSGCDPCDNTNLQNYLKAKGLLDAINGALACSPQMPNRASALLTKLTEFCNNTGCGCG